MKWTKIKLKIKQFFCSHQSYESHIEAHPAPMLFFELEAKCSDCGVTNYTIYNQAWIDYKLRIADNHLFSENMKKFPEFYGLHGTVQQNKVENPIDGS